MKMVAVYMPVELIQAIKAITGKYGMSTFIREAVKEKLERDKQ